MVPDERGSLRSTIGAMMGDTRSLDYSYSSYSVLSKQEALFPRDPKPGAIYGLW